VADNKRPPDRADEHAQQDSAEGLTSPLPVTRRQHQPQISLPFAVDTGSIAVSDRVQLHALLSSLPVILFALDRQVHLTMLEGSGVMLLPPSQQSMVGRSFFEFYSQSEETRHHVTKALKGTPVSWTEHLGDHLFVTTLTPLRDREDSIVGALGVGIETHSIARAAESTERARQSAADVSPLSQYFARVSHELRAPLNSIVGFANLMLKSRELHPDDSDTFYIQRITGNATHLLGVVADMMDLAAIEAGKAKITISEVDLGALIRETISETGKGSLPGSVGLRVEIQEDARPLETDRQKLKQVLINLLSNALKYTREGSITVTVSVDEFHRPVRIDVRDTGRGIPAGDLEAIFVPFEKGEKAAGQDIEGSGLGLTISRALCGLLGYSIGVVSEPGKGSTFTIELSQTTASQPR